jgi:hypothetical protein
VFKIKTGLFEFALFGVSKFSFIEEKYSTKKSVFLNYFFET